MILKPAPVSTERVMFQRDRNLLVAEVSDFGRSFAFGSVYDDACDVGLTLVSHRTGREVVYCVERTEYNHDGELMAWHLVPASRREQYRLPALVIFND